VPTEKRQRQKEGRQSRLLAQRKVQRRRQLVRRGAIVGVIAVIIGFTAYNLQKSSPATTTTTTTTTTTIPIPAKDKVLQTAVNAVAVRAGCPASLPTTSTPANHLHWLRQQLVSLSPSKSYYATFVTTVGSFKVRLNTTTTPVNTSNFLFLAEHRFYNCVPFHRVIPGFMNQSGDPTGTGFGGPGYVVAANEFPTASSNPAHQYAIGSLDYANSCPQTTAPSQCPDTNGSQFFIVAGSQGAGLPPKYTDFGQVVSGMPTVYKINAEGNPVVNDGGVPPYVTNRILSVTITNS
jgi:peptidylprolyl isomerase/peptidyl-prolyl cis-trans isomerase B (cyclophilin B)